MIEIKQDETRQILLTGTDDVALKREIEALFCEVDKGCNGDCYSLNRIRLTRPFLAKLFELL